MSQLSLKVAEMLNTHDISCKLEVYILSLSNFLIPSCVFQLNG